jgi:DUF1365 family protein
MPEITELQHASARGSTWHARLAPKEHRFKYRSAMLYLDLDHLDDFDGSRLQINRPGILSFKTDRHLCDDNQPSGDFARHLVTKELDVDVSGPVKLLTNPHCFGVGFNPLSVYFLHQASGSPAALIYEVSNTPWNEIHRYVIPYERVSSGQEYWFDKTFHVSPFNPTTQRYVTRVEWPTDGRASIYLGLKDQDEDSIMFEAGLTVALKPYDGRSLKPLFLGIWPQTFLVIGGIYREAFALWRKGLTYHPHP